MWPSLAAVSIIALLAAILSARLGPYIASPAARSFLARRARPLTEIIFVVSATLFALLRLFEPQPPDTRLALAIVIAALAWALHALIEDVVASWVVRMEGSIEAGRWIRMPGVVDGRVRRVGIRSAVIEDAGGDQVRVPLRDLVARSVTTADAAGGARAHTFTLEIAKTRALAPLLEAIPAAALTSPWSSTARPPEVDVRSETDDHYVIDVTTWALDPAFAPEIEAAVRRSIGSAASR